MAAVPSLGRAVGVEPRPLAVPEVDATRALYERYARQVHSYCLHQLKSREEAEDAVQTTFMNAFRGLQRGVVPAVEQAWLFKIAENVCLSRRRSSWRRGRIESPNDLEVLQEIIPSHSHPRDELIGLEDALGAMPENQRRAILLREWQGLSYREIAAELEISQAAVETLIFRARRSLAVGLEQPEPKSKRGRLRAGYNGVNVGAIFTAVKSALTGGAAVKAVVVAVAAGTATIAADPPNVLQRGSRPTPAPAVQGPAFKSSSPALPSVGARDNAHRFAPNAPAARSRAREARASHETEATPLATLPNESLPSEDVDLGAVTPPPDAAPAAQLPPPAQEVDTPPESGPSSDDPPRSSEAITPGSEISNDVNEVSTSEPGLAAGEPVADPATETAPATAEGAAPDPALGVPAADLAPEPAPTEDGDAVQAGTPPPNSNAGGNETAVASANSNAGGNDAAVAGANSNAGGNGSGSGVAGANSNAGGNVKPK